MRIMALDLGDVKIGIAMSDMLHIIANGYETYRRTKSAAADADYIARLAEEKDVDTIVMGLPINMDGTSGVRVDKTKEFAEVLKERSPNIKIVFQDERLTTVSAERMLIDADVRRDKRKQVVDKIAATIILQTYLDCKR